MVRQQQQSKQQEDKADKDGQDLRIKISIHTLPTAGSLAIVFVAFDSSFRFFRFFRFTFLLG